MADQQERSISVMEDRTHVRLYRVGAIECYPWWDRVRRRDPFWRLYANDKPGAFLTHERRRIPLEPAEVVLVPAWCGFGGRVTVPGIDHLYLHFDILNLSRPVTESWFPHPIVVRDPLCATAVSAARQVLHGDQGVALVCLAKAAVYSSLAAAVEALPHETQARWVDLVEGSSPLAGSIRFLEDHLADSITVDDMAARSRLGRDQFTRVFRRAFGQSPHHYLVDRRLSAAAHLLAFGDEGLDAIAERCGFTDRAHMSHLFLRRFGVSPGAYRKGRDRTTSSTRAERRAAGL